MKIIECKDCKNMYDCEYTYLLGCIDGEEWTEEPQEDNEK